MAERVYSTYLVLELPMTEVSRVDRVQSQKAGEASSPRNEARTASAARAVADALTEVTRKERRNLLAVSALLIALTFGGLIPTEITALGITFAGRQRTALLLLLTGTNIYFLIAFSLYARADILAWDSDLRAFLRERAKISYARAVAKAERTGEQVDEAEEAFLHEWPYERAFTARATFDVWFPLIFAALAIVAGIWFAGRGS